VAFYVPIFEACATETRHANFREIKGALIYLFVAAIYNVFFHPLRNFPGPTSRAASYLPFMYEAVRGSHAYSVKQLHDKYGPAVRIGPDRITFNDPAAFKDIYGHRPGRPNMAKAKLFYRQITKAPNIIVADDATHSRMRRAWGHAFSSKAVEEQQYIVKEYIDLLIKRLKPRAEGEEVVDMVAWYNWTTFDIIGKDIGRANEISFPKLNSSSPSNLT